MKIFITGYMGAGKSSAGRRIARRLGFEFIDMDDEFESMQGVSVSEYLLKKGEELFREKERDLLKEISLRNGDFVISTGGGTPCFYENMDLINRSGISVYLEMHPKSLAVRLEEAKGERPLLNKLKGDRLIQKIRDHLEGRKPFYEKAHITVKGENLDMAGLIEKITNKRKI